MRITRRQLRQLIKEEFEEAQLKSQDYMIHGPPDQDIQEMTPERLQNVID